MPLKKTALSILAVFMFVAYTMYEHAHADRGDLVTLIMSDIASRSTQGLAISNPQQGPSQDVQPAAPSRGTPAGYAAYVAQINAEAARNQASNSAGQLAPQTANPATSDQQSAKQQQAAAQAKAAAQAQQTSQYRNGAYTGSSVDVYYGYVQVEAVIQNGQLADVQFLQYPSDRSTSRYINSQAMPLLKQEAIQAQSAQVDGVSGASATSQGFVESLSSALSQAHA